MKLENVQIEIKNKEHYEAVKKRLQELGKWIWYSPDKVEGQAENKRYKAYINISCGHLAWASKDWVENPVTLDDLYKIKKEKVIKEMFDVYHEDRLLFSVGLFIDAENWIKNKATDLGEYSIRKTYRVMEE